MFQVWLILDWTNCWVLNNFNYDSCFGTYNWVAYIHESRMPDGRPPSIRLMRDREEDSAGKALAPTPLLKAQPSRVLIVLARPSTHPQ